MKKMIWIVAAAILLPLAAHGQSPSFYHFYDKYAGVDGYTTVEMSGAMFNSMNSSSKKGGNDSSDMLKSIKNMIIVVSENPSAEFRNDIRKLTRSGDYEAMTVIRDGSDVVEFYVVQKDGKPGEFLMVVMESRDCVVMSITGDNLNISGISQMAGQAAGIGGIELEELDL